VSLETTWTLAERWYGDRLSAAWRPRAPEEADALFEEVGLVGDFWRRS
jgi:hypothetical protein